ncbi:hypothetical protein GGI18_002729 [Coemansia linderi]|uniref:Uncharacterized protein n=1 Tax=Coemansia linderi TaxID=2663919 RepID=A0ACC1KFN5_9FUNG|nr:hypothetical protein GGI18_002729 [Coemansia linderi]
MSEEPPRHSPSPVEQYVEPPSDEQHAAEEQPPSPPADEQPSSDQSGDEPVDSYAAAGAPTSVDMTDAMTKARAIAAKLGSMQRPAPAALTLGDDAYESRTGEEERYRRRRSASPERDGGYKRGRGESRGRRFDVEPAFGEGAPMEFMVPAALVGLIIGRAGSNLRGIEQQHGPRGGYDQRGYDQRGGYDRQPQRGSGYGAQQAGGYGGGYAEASDPAMEQKAWSQQPQQPYYGGAQPAAQYGAAYQQGYQTQVAEQPQQWTNQMTADHYAQYAATNPEYAQYAEYYRKLAEKDPDGIVPSGN